MEIARIDARACGGWVVRASARALLTLSTCLFVACGTDGGPARDSRGDETPHVIPAPEPDAGPPALCPQAAWGEATSTSVSAAPQAVCDESQITQLTECIVTGVENEACAGWAPNTLPGREACYACVLTEGDVHGPLYPSDDGSEFLLNREGCIALASTPGCGAATIHGDACLLEACDACDGESFSECDANAAGTVCKVPLDGAANACAGYSLDGQCEPVDRSPAGVRAIISHYIRIFCGAATGQ